MENFTEKTELFLPLWIVISLGGFQVKGVFINLAKKKKKERCFNLSDFDYGRDVSE